MWPRRAPEDDAPSTAQERLEERLSAYLDDELTASERAEVEALLAADPAALETLDDLLMVTTALGALAEVRAPRSFAIPARPRAAGGSLAIVRRLELAMRGMAAAAALLFVVALVNDPGTSADTPVAGFSQTREEAGTLQQYGVETMRAADATDADDAASDAPAGGASLAPEAPEGAQNSGVGDASGVPVPEGAAADDVDGTADAGADEAAGTALADGLDASTKDSLPAGGAGASGGETLAAPPQTGTVIDPATSQGVGGVAPALATLAVLLALMAALMARFSAKDGVSR